MLLIIFYGEFSSFHKPVIPSLESQLNHEEFKLKSELQIKSWKKISSAKKKQATMEISQGLWNNGNFARVAKFRKGCEISQFVDPTKFHSLQPLRNFTIHSPCELGCPC